MAHNSAGPKYDIVGEDEKAPRGILANDAQGFVEGICKALDNFETEEFMELRKRARNHVNNFSDETFVRDFMIIFNKFVSQNCVYGKPKAT